MPEGWELDQLYHTKVRYYWAWVVYGWEYGDKAGAGISLSAIH